MQSLHWRYQNMKKADLENDPHIQDLNQRDEFSDEQKDIWRPAGVVPASRVNEACRAYAGGRPLEREVKDDVEIFEHRDFPGLRVIPGLLPPETQVLFTSCLMHRDLADPKHKINLQADYDIPYPTPHSTSPPPSSLFPTSFFLRDRAAPADTLISNALSKLKPLNTEQFLSARLRWLTLGEQYDWPTRSYAKHATPFPADLETLVSGLFPQILPQSGVVLIYSGKDHMPVHRDVSEQCQRALASFSLGCDGIFLMGKGEDEPEQKEDANGIDENNVNGEGSGVGVAEGQGARSKPQTVAIKVHSGDCVHLSGEARWAWHAMARTLQGTCPEYLKDWPLGTPGATTDEEKKYKKWRGYMGTKRINISCRQVWD